jgi:hypothetical protein
MERQQDRSMTSAGVPPPSDHPHETDVPEPVSTGWARREGGDVDPVRGPGLVRAATAAAGQLLPAGIQHDLAPPLGHDLRSIRIHADDAAARAAAALGARALTVGEHIVFGADEYRPNTEAGRRVLTHELGHVVQQREGMPASGVCHGSLAVHGEGDAGERDADRRGQGLRGLAVGRSGAAHAYGSAAGFLVQRLLREPYPWDGVVTPARGANVRSTPGSGDPATVLFALPKGARITVLGASGNWLRIETSFRGAAEVGYVLHSLVDDASAAAMAGTVGTTMVWRPSGPGSGTDFENWASAATETPFPAVSASTVMNCWEAVLLAAYRAGAISWTQIHNLYTSTPIADWVTAMSRGPLHTYTVGGPNPRMPQRGDIVFFDGIAHVAMATGSGSDVYTFWPPPNTPFSLGGTTDMVKVFSIEALVAWWSANLPPAPRVQFAAPSW